MWGPREVLNELRWRHDDLASARVFYVHRGAPDDTRVVGGDQVLRLETSFLVLADRRGEAHIPYHRVFRIERHGETVWERAPRDAPPEG
jgi:uncharacterized protein (UPF0248 family)